MSEPAPPMRVPPAQAAPEQDVGIDLPLHGLYLIEASAGTGKTFTLTSLVLRLLLERGLALPQILAVTFTRAATQELRQRLRRRLRLAQRLLETPDSVDVARGEAAITRAILRKAAARSDEDTVRARLAAALAQMDEAAVSTIHGFCHRALREFGFRAGSLAMLQAVDNADEVWQDVAGDLWRAASHRDDESHALLIALWQTPEALARDLPRLCDPLRVLYPERERSDTAAGLHVLREDAQQRFEAAMAARGRCSQDQLIERVWQASAETEFAAALAARWPVLLIDEFQDTDPRQWDIFRRMHDAADPRQRWLCLIGDPKQAIYRFRGGDLRTYLDARAQVAARADGNEGGIVALDANYRSTPAVLRAIETVFTARETPFVEKDIAFHPVRAAGAARDDDLRIGQTAVPGLTLHWLPAPPADPDARRNSAAAKGMRTRDQEFALMRAAAVEAIAGLLRHGRLREDGLERDVRPADIAVLTQTNDQVAEMRDALARAGIAAAALSSESVFAGEAAQELLALLSALAEPADPGRFRAALATRLLGLDAAAIAMLDEDTQMADTHAARFEQAAETWLARGPLPALLPFAADAAPRWLGMPGGARRLTDLLHLLELLQAESALRPGPAEQRQWFARQCANAASDEVRQLRLESDTGAVQVATVHRSKGLEYAVVVLPYAAYRSERQARGLHCEDFHDALGRPARIWRCKGVLDNEDWEAIATQVEREERAEAQRQWYVALTRARYALHVVWSRNHRSDNTALHWLLHGDAKTSGKGGLDHAAMRTRIEALVAASAGSIVMREVDPQAVSTTLAVSDAPQAQTVPVARKPRRRFAPDARLHSFSSLHAQHAAEASPRGAEDETAPFVDDAGGADGAAANLAVTALVPDPGDVAGLGGTAFGNAVHDALEAADFDLWRNAAGEQIPPGQRALIERALLRHGLTATPAHLAQTAALVARALHAPLPAGGRLLDLPPTRMVREMPFHFRLRPTRIERLHRLLETYGYPHGHRPQAATIEGLMQGYIDLVYRDDAGRHYVLDYKTNRLPGYDAESLRRSVAAQDYDLQYLIYLVALRRWLRLRRGDAFDPAREIGGAVYLFLRGLPDPGQPVSEQPVADGKGRAAMPGVHFDPVPAALLAELDALFDGVATESPA